MATLGILTLYNYDDTIFSGLRIPGAEDITADAAKVSDPFIPDKQTLINLICMRYAEMSLVYTDPEILKIMIKTWSDTRFPIWKSLYNTILYDYNPIWNKDGTITETRDLQYNTDEQTSGEVSSSGEADGYTAHDVTGYDVDQLKPDTKDTTHSETTSGAEHSGSRDEDRTETGTITRRETGNIGVTMTQEMIKQQREAVQFSLYDFIANDFKYNFCVMIY